jgi:anti-anti-sigma factor
MEIGVSSIADVVVMRLQGDLKARADITAVFWSHLQNGRSKFVLNFARVTGVDSVGFTALMELQRIAEASGGSIRICKLDEHVRKLFRAYGMEQAFSVFKDEDTALAGFVGALPVNCGEACHSQYLN